MTRYQFYFMGAVSPLCIAVTASLRPFSFWPVAVCVMTHVVASILFDTRNRAYTATAAQAAEIIAKAKADVAQERGAVFPYYVLSISAEDADEVWPGGIPETFEGARVAVSKPGTLGVAYGYRVKKEAAE